MVLLRVLLCPAQRVAGAPVPSPDPSRDPSGRESRARSTSSLFGSTGPRARSTPPPDATGIASGSSASTFNNRALAAADDHVDLERAAMDDASSPPDSRPRARARAFGDRFDDRYELLRSVGAGAFGQVYLARRREDDARVAVKKVELAGMDADARADTRNEVEVLRRLSHPNVVRYHEARVEHRVLHIVMEYVSGGDLAARLRDDPPESFTEDRVMRLFAQICLALRHLHDRGVLHRDLKTANIFVAEGDVVKLGDFGISKVLGSRSGFCSTVCGTPFYLSPEMCAGRRYDAKSDVWALGCVLYELCSGGRRAFEAPSLPAAVMKILKGAYPPLSAARWSPSARGLLHRLLRLEPAGRPAAREILRSPALRPHLRRLMDRAQEDATSNASSPDAERAGLRVLAREAAEGRDDEGAAFDPEVEHEVEVEVDAEYDEVEYEFDAEVEVDADGRRRDGRRVEVKASARVRAAREARGGDAFARELARESELAARREAGDARRRARRAERAAFLDRIAARDAARREETRLAKEARDAEKAARAANARRAKAAHDARVAAARASSRIDRRAVNPAFVGGARSRGRADVVLVPPPREREGEGEGDVGAGRETRGNGEDATEGTRDAREDEPEPEPEAEAERWFGPRLAAESTLALDAAALMARLAAMEEEVMEEMEVEEMENEDLGRDDRDPSSSFARATATANDPEEDGADDSETAPPELDEGVARETVKSNRSPPPAIPPSVAFEVSSAVEPPRSESTVVDVLAAPVADEEADGAIAATHIAHLRGQCIAELGVRRFARAYRIARRAAVAAAAEDDEEEGEETVPARDDEKDGDGDARGDEDGERRGDVRDGEIRGEVAGALGETRGCAPLLEMLVTLEEVQRAAERGGADFASLARGLEARGVGVERVVGR